jgi:hypothetical protein
LLKSEAQLPFKLRLARLLARHELADGYALATEHLADDGELLLPLATLVRSRNKRIALASLVALRRFLSGVRSSPRGSGTVEGTPLLAKVQAERRRSHGLVKQQQP